MTHLFPTQGYHQWLRQHHIALHMPSGRFLWAFISGSMIGGTVFFLAFSGAILSGELKALIMLLPHSIVTGLVFALWMTGLMYHGQD